MKAGCQWSTLLLQNKYAPVLEQVDASCLWRCQNQPMIAHAYRGGFRRAAPPAVQLLPPFETASDQSAVLRFNTPTSLGLGSFCFESAVLVKRCGLTRNQTERPLTQALWFGWAVATINAHNHVVF
jgi:hypothetical protein